MELTEKRGCQGTSISFNEPTLSLEWSLDVFRLARQRGLYNTYVTNGYMTPEALSLLIDAGLDAMNVDVKGDAAAVRKFCKGVDVEKVWAICKIARSHGVHIEVTTLVVPGVNDSDMALRSIAQRIVNDSGSGGALARHSVLSSVQVRCAADARPDVGTRLADWQGRGVAVCLHGQRARPSA